MANERDEFLNELIKYYDSEANEKKSEQNIGDTQVIKKSEKIEKKENLGNTIIMKPKKKTNSDISKKQNKESKQNEKSIDEQNETEIPPIVKEEVLGSLDLEGKPITEIENTQPEKESEEELEKEFEEKPMNIQKSRPVRKKNSYVPKKPRQYKKEKRSLWYELKPLWVTLIVSAICVGGFKFYMTDNGLIGTYKNNFKYNMNMLLDMLGINTDKRLEETPVVGAETIDESLADVLPNEGSIGENVGADDASVQVASNMVQYDSVKRKLMTIPFDEAGSSEYSLFNNGVVCVKSNYMCYMNSKGEKVWETETDINDPTLSTAGDYIAVASSEGNHLSLYKRNKLCYTQDIPNIIRSCDVSERGDVVLVTDKSAYKGAITVINKRGENIFSWSSGVNYITQATISRNRIISTVLVNTTDITTSYIMNFDVHDAKPVSGIKLENTLIFDLTKYKNSVQAVGDNCLALVSETGKAAYDLRFDNTLMTHEASDSGGNRIVSYTADNIPVIDVYSRRGISMYRAVLNATPDFVDISSSAIVYNDGRIIIGGKYDSDKFFSYTAPMTIQKLMLVNNRIFMVVYESSIEFIKI